MSFRVRIFLLALAALSIGLPAFAQSPRGPRTVIRGGMLQKPDTLRTKRDSTRIAEMLRELDSIGRAAYIEDSLAVTALRTDDIRTTDSLLRIQMLAGKKDSPADSTALVKKRKGWFMSDSMSLSKVCWISTVIPGYGQIYNKQYWKLPILYGALGAGIGLFIAENKTYRPLKKEFDALTSQSNVRTPELDAVQAKMIRSNTKRQLYLGVSIASYIYFIGDAAIKYSTNEVSDVKKATTLACICPGAGQIYNKSYWKVPFVIGGFAAMIYVIDWNNRVFNRYQQLYTLRLDYDKNPDKYPDGLPPDLQNERTSASNLKNYKNSARRNRDLAIILTAGLYVLQIVDAHVDAHLKDYDVSDDLSMDIEPMVNYTYVPSAGGNRPVFGFNLSFKF